MIFALATLTLKIYLRTWPISRVVTFDFEKMHKKLQIKGLDYLEVLRPRLGCKKADKFPQPRKAQGE